MKTILFLSARARYIELYDFEKIIKTSNCRHLLLIGQEEVVKTPKKIKNYFDGILFVPMTTIAGEPNSRLDYQAAQMITKGLHQKNKDIRIICIDEGSVLLAAKLRDEFDLPGPRSNEVALFCDKDLMYRKLSGHQILTPKSVMLDLNSLSTNKMKRYYNQIIQHVGSPFIVKPKTSSGSFYIKRITSFQEFSELKQLNTSFEYIINEEIIGNLHHCDIQIANSKIIFSSCNLYLNPLLNFLNGDTVGSIPLQDDNCLYQDLLFFVSNIFLNVLKINMATIHAEAFRNAKREWVFLEAAHRPPGTAIIKLYEKYFDINLCNSDYLIAIGKIPVLHKKKHPCFVIAAPKQRGFLHKKHFPSLKSDYDIHWFVNEHQFMDKPQSIADKAMIMFAYNKNYKELMHEYLMLKKFKFITTDTYR